MKKTKSSPNKKQNDEQTTNNYNLQQEDSRSRRSPSGSPYSFFSSSSSDSLLRIADQGKVEEMKQLLFQKNIDVNMTDNFGSTPLHLVCFRGHVECVKFLLKCQEIEVNCCDVYQRTPLFHACRGGHSEIVTLLLEHGADISLNNNSGESPLSKACSHGYFECVKILLSFQRQLNKRGEGESVPTIVNQADEIYGNSPLHQCASKGDITILKFLLAHGGNINAKNKQGYTPLHLSVICGQVKCASFLLEHGAELDTKNSFQKTPLMDAKEKKNEEMIDLLEKGYRQHIEFQLEELLNKKPLTEWTSLDVSKWLSLIGFSEYVETFLLHDITGNSLSDLNVTILKNELNISSYGHRLSILQAIHSLFKTSQKLIPLPQTSYPTSSSSTSSSSVLSQEYFEKQPWYIDYSQLEIGDLLGRGFFGEVRKAKWKGTDVAVKVMYRNTFGKNKEQSVFEKEFNVISKLRHTRVLMFLGVTIENGNYCIITEYLSGGNLSQLIHFSWETLEKIPLLRRRIASDIVIGMTYLHNLNILHRDLTPKNLLLDSHMDCKIADFGLSKMQDLGEMTHSLGCLPYQSPEVFKGETYTKLADIYSFGCVLYELFSGFEPNKGFEPLKYANMVAYENFRPFLPEFVPQSWKNLINELWHKDPKSRPSAFSEILSRSIIAATQERITPLSKFDELTKNIDYTVGSYEE